MVVEVKTRCPRCQKEGSINVSLVGYEAWKSGMLIQNAFPELNADQREQLMTGICPECWDKMFAPKASDMDIDMYEFTAPEHVEIRIRADKSVVWINVNGVCAMRLCQIKNLTIENDSETNTSSST